MAYRFYPWTIPWEDISDEVNAIIKKKKKGKKTYPWNIPWERISKDIDFINTYGISHQKHDETVNKSVNIRKNDELYSNNIPDKKWEHLHLYLISEDIDFIE